MTREELIRHSFTKESRLIEVGASYNPIVPKADGWQTTVIDHADQDALRQKYRDQSIERIEPVDAVWSGEPLEVLLSEELGRYDGVIASHVGEHLPDLIGFLKSIDCILKPSGVIVLALPDKRLCFDFFRPVTTTGMLLEAHAAGRTRHSRGQIFDSHAYFVTRGGQGAWARDVGLEGGEPTLVHSLAEAFSHYCAAQDGNYHDAHGWCFTPTSFRLNIIELYGCGVIPWSVVRLERAAGVEFYVWLERRRIRLPDAQIEAERQRLLLAVLRENAADTLLQLTASPVPEQRTLPKPKAEQTQAAPTISAIVPLYNGARFIRKALQSILEQTYLPLEIIVVNDHSLDNSAEVVRDFQARHLDANIFLVDQPENGGQSSARNRGACMARGDLIAFLDQDDVWYAMHLEHLVKPFIDQPPGQPLGWVYSDLDEAEENGHVIHHKFLMTLPAPHHPKSNLYQCLDRDMFVLPSASLISRAVFNEVGGYDERLSGYEDDDLFLRIFRAGKLNVFIPESLSKWCIHEGSSSYTPRMRRSRAIYCRKLLAMFPDKPDRNIYFSRDTILPRFYRQAQVEFRRALKGGDVSDIADSLNELRFLLDVAVQGDGINTLMTHRRAKRLKVIFDRMTPCSALRRFRYRNRWRPIVLHRIPMSILRQMTYVFPLYG